MPRIPRLITGHAKGDDAEKGQPAKTSRWGPRKDDTPPAETAAAAPAEEAATKTSPLSLPPGSVKTMIYQNPGGAGAAWLDLLKVSLPQLKAGKRPCWWHHCVVRRGDKSQCRHEHCHGKAVMINKSA